MAEDLSYPIMGDDFTIDLREHKRADVITLKGRFDSVNSAQLDAAFKDRLSKQRYKLVLELSGVEYMSSAALRAMVSVLRESKKNVRGGDVRLASPSERVAEVLELAGLDSLYQVHDDAEAAVGSF